MTYTSEQLAEILAKHKKWLRGEPDGAGANLAGTNLTGARGPQRAGAMIYRASTGRVPYFFGATEAALEDIKACAARSRTP